MTDASIVMHSPSPTFQPFCSKASGKRPDLHFLWLHPESWPAWVTQSPTLLRYLEWLGPLDWANFPERNLVRNWGQTAIPYAALAAAILLKLNEGMPALKTLRRFLVEHPGFIWAFGFPVNFDATTPLGFNAQASLPTQRHLTQMLRHMPNAVLQNLLSSSVQLILVELAQHDASGVECISLDTKHILAWVKENNPKAYVSERFNKERQPPGDPDCKLGCKRRHNQRIEPATPTRSPVAGSTLQVGEYYWGYGSGIVVTKVPGWGEFVLAEWTQPFDCGDVSYFFPLMRQVEEQLGYQPRYGTFDAAFDAWYVYAYFYRANDPDHGFAAVPFSEKGGYKAQGRQFTAEGGPRCAAGLPMPLLFTFTNRTSCLVEHTRGKYGCPLCVPTRIASACPMNHKNWKRGGCTAMMPISMGACLRYTLDRASETYKRLLRQRTAVERINSQAVALGIERPHLRNARAIANQNTLIYLLINLRFLQRLRQQGEELE